MTLCFVTGTPASFRFISGACCNTTPGARGSDIIEYAQDTDSDVKEQEHLAENETKIQILVVPVRIRGLTTHQLLIYEVLTMNILF